MSSTLKGHLSALFSCVVWGSTFISTKVLLGSMQPLTILLIRFIVGLLMLFLLNRHPIPFLGWKKELVFAGAGFCGLTVYYWLENTSLLYASASLVSVIICTAPFFVALCSWLFLKTGKPRWTFWLGFLISMGGICLLSFSDGLGGQSNPIGVLMVIGAAFSWGFYSILTKKAETFGYSTVQITQRIFLYGILFLIPVVILSEPRFDPSALQRPEILLNLLFLGIVASALCFVTWNTAMKHIGTLASSVYIYLTPVVTVALSVPILHEQLTLQSLAGIVLTLLGVILSER